MSLLELLADCDARGIRLLAAGNGRLTIDAPKGGLTPDLLQRVKTRKAELLSILTAEDVKAAVCWQVTLDQLEGPAVTSPDLMRHLRTAEVRWEGGGDTTDPVEVDRYPEEALDADGWPSGSFEPPDPCQCGAIEFWWDLLGHQHCERCDPPHRQCNQPREWT